MLLSEVEAYQNLEILANQVVEGFITGLHRSPFHGFSVEFAEHRQYNQGESTRHIDWKLYGKTDKLFVKKYEEETNLRCKILLDISGSMYFPEKTHNKLRFATLAAASICNLLKKQRDAFGILGFSDKIQINTEIKSSQQHFQNILQNLHPFWANAIPMPKLEHTSKVAEIIETVAHTIHKRSLIVVLSDMFDSEIENEKLWRSLQQLKYNKHEVVLFHIVHKPSEVDFNFGSRVHRFVDAETQEKLLIYPTEIKEVYQTRFTQFEKELRQKCLQYKIDFYTADTAKDFNQILLPFYIKRSKMA